jgi:hypothetical protein
MNAWQYDDRPGIARGDEPRGRADRVGNHHGSLRHSGLLQQAIYQLDPAEAGDRSDVFGGDLVFDEVDPHHLSNSRRSNVVFCGPQSAGGEDDIGSIQTDA